jgi:DNA-binding CsgD family transcriptional regulator
MPHILYSFAMYEESVAAAREGIAVHVRAGLNRYGQIGVRENGIGALCALGRPAEAVEMLGDEPEAISPDVGIWLHVRHAQLGAMLGDLDAAAARFVRCRAVPGLNAMVLAPICALQAETALWREDVETALEAVVSGEAKLVEDERLDAAPLLCTAVRVQAAAAAAGVVAPDAARAEADRLIARLRRVVSKGTAPLPEPDQRLVHALAERSRLEPSPDPAAWAAATAGWTALRRPYEAAYSGWRWAEALASARGPRDEVEHVLRNAHAAAVGVGTPHLVAAITGLARRARIALPGLEHDEHAPFGDLTAREREVLALVADGRTNRQIAEELFITDKTASVHVSNILAKLGAANRGEAAALAHRAGFDNEPSLQG